MNITSGKTKGEPVGLITNTATTAVQEEEKPETELSPSLRRMLLTNLGKLQALKRQREVIEKQETTIKDAIEKLFVDAKEDHLLVEGVRVQGATLHVIAGLYEAWDEKKFLARGLNAADFKVTKTKKPYLSIRLPKDAIAQQVQTVVDRLKGRSVSRRGQKESAQFQPDFMGK